MLIDLLLVVVFALHLMAMNVATAGPLLCVWLDVRWRGGDEAAGLLGRRLARLAVTALWVGMILGLAAGGLLWLSGDEPFFQALATVPRRRLWWGVAELAVYLIGMEFYIRRWGRMRPLWHRTLAVFSATNLMYHFPPLFAGVAVISTQPALWGEELGYRELMRVFFTNGQTLARVFHFLLASAAVAGVAMMGAALKLARSQQAPLEDCQRTARSGARLALAASLLQLPIGMWLLIALPTSARSGLMGTDLAATALLSLGLLTMFALLHHLAAVSLGDEDRKLQIRTMALLLVLILLMTGVSRRAQQLAHQRLNFEARNVSQQKVGPAVPAATMFQSTTFRPAQPVLRR